MSPQPVDPIPAATVILLRDRPAGFEVLMVHRTDRGFFGGLAVFPGGAVDNVDHSDLARSVVKTSAEDGPHRAAALRELAEETGLLLTAEGVLAAPDAKEAALYGSLRDANLELDGDRLVLVSRWVTPEPAPRRFDTRFYVAAVDQVPSIRLDADELIGHTWIRPAAALEHNRRGQWSMFLPTISHLRWLERRQSVEEALQTARGADGRTLIEPREMEDGSLVPLLLPVEET